MRPSKEMRERAWPCAEAIAEVMERPLRGPSVDAAAFGIAAFATAEVSRAVEDIETAAKTIAWGDSVLLPGGYAVVPETWLREAANRAVRECIEAQCAASCDDSDFECKRSSRGVWVHEYIDDDGIARRSDYEVCCVSVVRELLYQQQLASEGEEK